MRYFIDTEFNAEIGPNIELISIGIYSEDDRSYYAVSSEFNPDTCSDWVKKNVFPKLGAPEFNGPAPLFPHTAPITLLEMKDEIREFTNLGTAQFWGYYADWDWLLLGQQIMGGMMRMPDNWRMLCMDVKQWQIQIGAPEFPGLPNTQAHNALNDAKWTKEYYDHLVKWSAATGDDQGDFF